MVRCHARCGMRERVKGACGEQGSHALGYDRDAGMLAMGTTINQSLKDDEGLRWIN